MKEQEVIKRLNFHKEHARLSSNRVVISETDLETVLNILKQNSAELAEKSAEIEKYKSLYNKALKDLVQAEKKKCQKDKINELLINFIYKMSIIRPGTIMYDLREDGFDTSKCGNCKGKSCKNCIKQYFKQKAINNG